MGLEWLSIIRVGIRDRWVSTSSVISCKLSGLSSLVLYALSLLHRINRSTIVLSPFSGQSEDFRKGFSKLDFLCSVLI